MAHKSYGKQPKQRDDGWQPPTFDFYNEDDLRCRPNANSALLLRIIGDVNATEDVGRQSDGLLKVFDALLLPEDKPRFFTMINDPEVEIEMEDLAQAATELVNDYIGRPTKSDSASPNGTSQTRRLSAVAPSSQPDDLGPTPSWEQNPPQTRAQLAQQTQQAQQATPTPQPQAMNGAVAPAPDAPMSPPQTAEMAPPPQSAPSTPTQTSGEESSQPPVPGSVPVTSST